MHLCTHTHSLLQAGTVTLTPARTHSHTLLLPRWSLWWVGTRLCRNQFCNFCSKSGACLQVSGSELRLLAPWDATCRHFEWPHRGVLGPVSRLQTFSMVTLGGAAHREATVPRTCRWTAHMTLSHQPWLSQERYLTMQKVQKCFRGCGIRPGSWLTQGLGRGRRVSKQGCLPSVAPLHPV